MALKKLEVDQQYWKEGIRASIKIDEATWRHISAMIILELDRKTTTAMMAKRLREFKREVQEAFKRRNKYLPLYKRSPGWS